MSDRPDVEQQRQILTAKRDQWRAEAFDAEMSAYAISETDTGDPSFDQQAVSEAKQLRLKAKKMYAMARKMDEKLEKLPEPEEDESGDTGEQ